MSTYRSRQRKRVGFIVVLGLLALVGMLGPILYVISAPHPTTQGPVVGPRTR